MAAVVKEEPEAPFSLSLLLGERNPRCKIMTASALVGGAPPPAHHHHNLLPQTHAALQQQDCNVQHNTQHSAQTHQPLMNGRGGGHFERVPPHSPSNLIPTEASKRHPSPNKPPANDPLSHRIIEKRRRDRMNNCLADLSRLIPTYYLKKGRGRIEKTEIIEMAIKYMKHLQAHACNQIENCEVTAKQERTGNQLEQFHLGYQECMSETMQFLVESEGFFTGDSLCVRLMNHLTKHCEKILTSEGYVTRQSGASSSTSSGYHANSSSTGSSSDGNGNGPSHASESKDTLASEEMAYRSEERPGADEREEKSAGTSSETNSGMGSQLREILQQHSGPGSSSDRRCGGYSSGLSSNNSSSGDDNNNISRLYKFKSNMKHRFSADLEQSHQVRKKRRDSESSCGNYTDCEKDRGTPTGPVSLLRLTSCQDGFSHDTSKLLDERSSPMLEKNQRSSTLTPKCEIQGDRGSPHQQSVDVSSGNSVPIFALNQSGRFYVPLTIDSALIAPVMEGLSNISPVLHPISISVNFCGSCPTITSNIVSPNQSSCTGTLISNSYQSLGNRLCHATHNSTMNNFESSIYNGRPYTRVVSNRKRCAPSKQISRFQEQHTGLSNTNDSVEKREPEDLEMCVLHEVKEHHHCHSDHEQRDISCDPPSWIKHMPEKKDTKDQEKCQEVKDMKNAHNLRDIHELWDIRDPAQTVREFIDTNSNYSNNSAYSRTHPHWTPAYHSQLKN
nr:transcription factor cwo-like [Procambarus clarkii]